MSAIAPGTEFVEHDERTARGRVAEAVRRAREALRWEGLRDQETIDAVVRAVGRHWYAPEVVAELAHLSRAGTGMGDVGHLYELHRRRVLGTMRDLHGRRTVGFVDDPDDEARGLRRLARPLGVIAVVTPATAPCPAVATSVLSSLKTGNAAIVSAHPRATEAVAAMWGPLAAALAEVGAPEDLVRFLPDLRRDDVDHLMATADFVVATGGRRLVRRAYTSGTPAVGAGQGNATVLVHGDADLAAAADLIVSGAGYNHGTSCSSESNVLVDRRVWADFLTHLERRGVRLCAGPEARAVERALWPDGRGLDRDLVGRPAATLAAAAGLEPAAATPTVLAAVCTEIDSRRPLFGEKLSPVVTVAPYDGFAAAVEAVRSILDHCGAGHSCGIHTGAGPEAERRVEELAVAVPSSRVMVGQSTMGNAGSFGNGLEFTSVVAAGSWGGCSVSHNVGWRDLLQYTTISRPLVPELPDERVLFGQDGAGPPSSIQATASTRAGSQPSRS